MNTEILSKIITLDKKGSLRDEIIKELQKEMLVSLELKEQINKHTFPDKLFYLLKKYVSCRKHLERNKRDIVNNRQLIKKKYAIISDLRYRSNKDSSYNRYLDKDNLDLLLSTCQRYLVAHSK